MVLGVLGVLSGFGGFEWFWGNFRSFSYLGFLV